MEGDSGLDLPLGPSEYDDDEEDLPVVPSIPRPERKGYDQNPKMFKCGECGKVWRRIEYYSCPNTYCPIQRKSFL